MVRRGGERRGGVARLALALSLPLGFAACESPADPASPQFLARAVDVAEASFDIEAFSSSRKDASLSDALTLSAETRLSLIPPIPSSLGYDVLVPESGVLRFAIGVATLGESEMPAPVTFTVTVSAGGEETLVFEDDVRRASPNLWHERHVALDRWGGQRVRLTFSVRFRETPYTRRADELEELGRTLIPAWGSPVLDAAEDPSPRPNLLLVSIDCLRADHVGAYGYHRDTTPSIDAVAADGVVFEDAVSVSSWTLPTHMSMLTGVMPSQHGAGRSTKRDDRVPFVPELLAAEGYETLGVVSGGYLSQAFGFEGGFDVYRFLKDESADKVVDAAIGFLGEEARDRFLFVHLFDAHWPYRPPDALQDRFGEPPERLQAVLRKVVNGIPPESEREIRHLEDLYDAEVAFVDGELRRLFEALRERGMYEDTVILVTADHGEAFWEHGKWQHSELIYNEVTSIPLVVKWAGGSPSGTVSTTVTQLNVFPTLLEAAGLASNYATPGLLEIANGRNSADRPVVSEIIWEPNESRGAVIKVAVRRGSYKYIAAFAGDKDDENYVSRLVEEELYDLSTDWEEQRNLLAEDAPRAHELEAYVRAHLEEVRRRMADRRGEEVVLDEALKEELRALGYITE